MELVTQMVAAAWDTLARMAPYLLFGFLAAGILSVLVSPETVEKHLGGRGAWPVVKAALFGVPLPLCSCGVLPVAASLRRHGASKGSTVAFLISTPQTGVDSILVTYGLLGPVFALFRPIAAFLSGVLGGWTMDAFERGGAPAAEPEACHDECCEPGAARRPRYARALRYAFLTLPRDIARPLLVGLVAAGVISAAVPKEFFEKTMDSYVLQMLAMMVVGIPLYVCATASVPIAAAMILKGISPGAALVFLMTGPATNAASIATVWKLMGRRSALVYLGAVAGTAMACGLALDAMLAGGIALQVRHCHEASDGWVGTVSAVVLLALLGIGIGRGRRGAAHREHGGGNAAGEAIGITGMTCEHCAQSVREALMKVPGVESAEVSFKSGIATVRGSGYDRALLLAAVEKTGYSVR